MIENNGHLHVYSTRAGAINPLKSNVFHKTEYSVTLVISCKIIIWKVHKFFPLNDFATVFFFFQFKCTGDQIDFAVSGRSRSTQGHQSYTDVG